MWINFDQLLDLPNVTVVNYQKIDQTIFLKLAIIREHLSSAMSINTWEKPATGKIWFCK
ncbi:hypothetical protein MiYa_03951 [Microcystis aeruginosa NIES-2519]|uniref:Uncharacterized protein n=1 Tax=Microcystis aeruginosa NIES-2519 TaxID=2303981 RepID=A0A5A5R8R3_MICAE|nr:hypothetical protein MiYa_03951 [Microcystis aeruginosa NIES-2519]GCA85666.1 hypothetical protein MiHa_03650 [Microcystis aeruginosa NIES-2522]GCA89697.1 hypothetical protein MiTa_03049 [Microcystis aeruginosa NIES-4264]